MFSPSRPVTGRAVLAITLAAFATVVAANVVLAVMAVETFPGLEVANSYVASQDFDAEARSQQALGWTTEVALAGGRLTLAIRDRAGAPVAPRAISATLFRPTEAREDIALALVPEGAGYAAAVAPAAGRWRLRIEAQAADGTRFRVTRDLVAEASR